MSAPCRALPGRYVIARRLSVALSSAVLAVVAACATPPRHETPPPLPLARDSLGLKGEADAPAADAWWDSFNDAQLSELIRQALESNPSLAQAGSRVRAAQAVAAGARADQFPRMKASGGETRLKIPSGFPPAIDGGSTVWVGDLGAVLSWDLDLWGKHADTTAQTQHLDRKSVV